MRKFVLLIALALFGFLNVNAQDNGSSGETFESFWKKGDVYISGSVGISSSKFGEAKGNQFNVMPQAGFLVTDHIAIGAQIGYMSEKYEFDGTTTEQINTFMAGAYGKWICSPETRFTPYLGLGFNYVTENYEEANQPDIKYDGFEVGAGAGLIYNLNEHFFLGANYAVLSYSTMKSDEDNAESLNTFTAGLDWKQLSFSLGYRF